MSFELSLSAARGGVALAGELAAHTLAAFSNDEVCLRARRWGGAL